MKRFRTTMHRYGFQFLENRTLMAGNVAAVVSKGSLVLTGDQFDNNVVMTAGPQPGQFYVSGAAGTNTTINGQAAPVLVQGVAKDITAAFAAGNDTFNVDTSAGSISLPGKLTVSMGDGNDKLDLRQNTPNSLFKVADTLSVDLGAGTDSATLVFLTVGGQNINKNHNDLLIAASDGDDKVFIQGVNVARNLSVDDHTGTQSDDFFIDESNVAGDMTVKTGNGSDFIFLENSKVLGKAQFEANQGNDSLTITSDQIDKLCAKLGDGDDFAFASYSDINNASFDGGKGNDRLSQLKDAFGHLQQCNFETVTTN